MVFPASGVSNYGSNEMLERASDFAEPWFPKRTIFDSIKEILDKPKFQKNPEGYLRTWKQERKNSTCGCIDEIVFQFFKQNYKF